MTDIPSVEEFEAAERCLEALGSVTGTLYNITTQNGIEGSNQHCIAPPLSAPGAIRHYPSYIPNEYQYYWYTRAVALKLLIETDEREFLRVAGRPGLRTRALHEHATV